MLRHVGWFQVPMGRGLCSEHDVYCHVCSNNSVILQPWLSYVAVVLLTFAPHDVQDFLVHPRRIHQPKMI